MARLEAAPVRTAAGLDPSFQFLMVRLEAPAPRLSSPPMCVSIPYGSIRRFAPQTSITGKRVSIPYGSIRSALMCICLPRL